MLAKYISFFLILFVTHSLHSEIKVIDPSSASIPQIQVVLPEERKICLNMIVKNESKIIKRCLNSVKDIVDYVSICDTGSTDNTVALIEEFMRENQIPGKIHHHVWKNFGHNRTLSATAAQDTLKELNFDLANTYLLLLDADMQLEIDPSFNFLPLIADEYYILQKDDWQSYYNTRLIRASLPWTSIGPTHEYWSCNKKILKLNLPTLQIDDRNDGGSKSDKFHRDLQLLLDGLKEEPDNVRYMFYLAQTYNCLECHDDSIKWYKKRIAAGGWFEEVWYSKLMIGTIYDAMDLWDQALHWYLEAYQSNPDRAEPLQKIACHYRENSQNHLAYLFAKQGSRIPFPNNQVLFISRPAYEYQFDEEISIAAFYCPSFKEEGFLAADKLVFNKKVPQYIKDQSYRNLIYYAQPLPAATYIDANLKNLQKVESTPKVTHPYYEFPRFLTSTPHLNLDDGYLLLVNETVNSDNIEHRLHRFVFVDQNYAIQKMSRPFIFKQKGPETTHDMTFDFPANKCLITYSMNEEKTGICTVDIKTIQSILKPLP